MNPTTGGEGKRSFDIDRTGGGRCRRASLSGNCAQRNYGGIADLAPSACLAKNGGGRCLESDGDRALRECRNRPSFVCISGWDLIRHCVAYKDSARPRVAADRRLTVNAGGDPSCRVQGYLSPQNAQSAGQIDIAAHHGRNDRVMLRFHIALMRLRSRH